MDTAASNEENDDLYDRVIDQVMRGQAIDVEALLAQHPQLSEEQRSKVRKLVRAAGIVGNDSAHVGSTAATLPFERIAAYRLLAVLGEGGMGMVYLAEHEFLKRRVALKLVRPELRLSQTTRERFQREALAVARLKHPHIVTVHDAGEERGIAYLAMELVEGQGLDERLAQLRQGGGRMPVREAVQMASDIAAGLHSAHQAGVLHRDVKPSNIRIDTHGKALLLDFGLAQAEGTAAVSVTGMFRGTPAYASPEQVNAGALELDARSDVYSLSATLYECLTGKVPFEGATTLQLFQRILTATPRSPRECNPDVDAQLQAIVLRALSKDREARPESAQAYASELNTWLSKFDSSPAHTTPTHATARAWPKALFVAGVLGSVLAASVWYTHAPQPADMGPLLARPARLTTPLFGAADLDFGQRLVGWESTQGPGTFGDDEDSSGIIGVCMDGLALKGHNLPASAVCVRGTLELLPVYNAQTQAERPTVAAGLAVEYADGRVTALAVVEADGAYVVELCDLQRTDSGVWSRGKQQVRLSASDHHVGPLACALRWEEAATQAEWTTANGVQHHLRFPSELTGTGHPVQIYVWVESGNVRCTDAQVEEL